MIVPPQAAEMRTAEQHRKRDDAAAIFDWRVACLTRAGYRPDDAWALASNKWVDVRLAERLLAQGCPRETALRILS